MVFCPGKDCNEAIELLRMQICYELDVDPVSFTDIVICLELLVFAQNLHLNTSVCVLSMCNKCGSFDMGSCVEAAYARVGGEGGREGGGGKDGDEGGREVSKPSRDAFACICIV